MAEPDLSFPLALDLPELLLEQGPGHLADEMDEETKLLLLGPQDENHLPPIFGLLDTERCKELKLGLVEKEIRTGAEDKSNSVFADDESEAEQMHLYHEMAEYNVVPSLLDLLPVQYGWGGGRRKCCKRRKSCWGNAESNSRVQYGWGGDRRKCRKKNTSCSAEISHPFGLLKPSARRGTTFGGRKKIKQWTPPEAEKLVEGVSIFGVGSWAAVKRAYFKTSFRKEVHLKDKWRDLLRACGIDVGSKKKVQPQRATQKIIEGSEEQIRFLHAADQSKRAT